LPILRAPALSLPRQPPLPLWPPLHLLLRQNNPLFILKKPLHVQRFFYAFLRHNAPHNTQSAALRFKLTVIAL
jgi:hypothetical protein